VNSLLVLVLLLSNNLQVQSKLNASPNTVININIPIYNCGDFGTIADHMKYKSTHVWDHRGSSTSSLLSAPSVSPNSARHNGHPQWRDPCSYVGVHTRGPLRLFSGSGSQGNGIQRTEQNWSSVVHLARAYLSGAPWVRF
jgi:hypothetical protein